MSPSNRRTCTTTHEKPFPATTSTSRKQQPLPPHTRIRPATPADLTYIEHLARIHVNAIGFVPSSAYRDHIDRGNINVVTINQQHAGFSLTGGGHRKPYRIIQVAITDEMWRQGIGTALIAKARTTATTRPIPTVSASIRDGLPMQKVAEQTGAKLIAISTRPTARARILTHWIWQPLPDVLDLQERQTSTILHA